MKIRQSDKVEEAQTECKVGKEFQQIINRQRNIKERTTETIIRKTIKRELMKNN